jgi:hypothetical protein
MSTDLKVGERFTPVGYRTELTLVSITDHTDDSIGHIILEAVDSEDFAWFVWDGVVIRGEHR